MATQTYEQAVEKTVKWWSEKAFATPLNQNNGDNSPGGGLAFMLSNLVSSKAQSVVTPEQIKIFEKELTRRLMLEEDSREYYRMLTVDYHPNKLLQLACDEAGIDPACLPCKTTTNIDKDNKVMASYQYRGPWIEL